MSTLTSRKSMWYHQEDHQLRTGALHSSKGVIKWTKADAGLKLSKKTLSWPARTLSDETMTSAFTEKAASSRNIILFVQFYSNLQFGSRLRA